MVSKLHIFKISELLIHVSFLQFNPSVARQRSYMFASYCGTIIGLAKKFI